MRPARLSSARLRPFGAPADGTTISVAKSRRGAPKSRPGPPLSPICANRRRLWRASSPQANRAPAAWRAKFRGAKVLITYCSGYGFCFLGVFRALRQHLVDQTKIFRFFRRHEMVAIERLVDRLIIAPGVV